jgi:hypothetical protein
MSKGERFEDFNEAVSVIRRNGGKINGNVIKINQPGLKVWAAIDFLVNHHKFIFGGGE